MTRKSIKQISWTGGQIADYAMSLQDHILGYETFLRSSKKIENAIILPTTGIKRRGGLRYIETTGVDDNARIFFFHERLNTSGKYQDECFIVVVGDKKIEIYDCEGNVKIPKTPFTQSILDDFTPDRLNDINIGYTSESLIFVHGNFTPKKLTLKDKKDDTSWELTNINFTFDKQEFAFDDPNTVGSRIGYPKYISTIANRLILAGTDLIPHGIWFSKVDIDNKERNLFDFTVGTGNEKDAIIKYLALRNVEIVGILVINELFIFTNVGIIITNEQYTPKDLDFRLAIKFRIIGNPHPFYANNKRFFFSNNILESFSYSREVQTYISSQASSMFADMNIPNRIAILDRKDNNNPDMIFILSRDRRLQVISLIKQLTQSESLDGVALSEWTSKLEFIDVQTNNKSELYFLLLDKNNNKINIGKYDEDYLLDNSVKYQKTNFSNGFNFQNKINYLENQTIGIVADDIWFGEKYIVSKGKIDEFSSTVKENIEVGIPYYFSLEKIIPMTTYIPTVALAEINMMLYNTSSLNVHYKSQDKQIINKPIAIPLDRNELKIINKEKVNFTGSISNNIENIYMKWYQKAPLHVNIMSIEYIFNI